MDQESLKELARSIEKYGILHPISVWKEEDIYKISLGHRRFLAYKFLSEEGKISYKNIFSRVIERPLKLSLTQFMENIQRKDLSHYEYEKGFSNLLKEYNLTQNELSKTLLKSDAWISSILKAERIREKLTLVGIKTENISTSAIINLENIPIEKIRSLNTKNKEITKKLAIQIKKNHSPKKINNKDNNKFTNEKTITCPSCGCKF